MLYRVSMCEIPPLFVELNMLNRNESGKYDCWKEKARWIRFEENAEDDVTGRWSKPHVATITHTAIDDLKELAASAKMVFGANLNSIKELADVTANELLDSLNLSDAQHFAELMCLPFVHHHEKHSLANAQQSVKKTPSGNSLAKLTTSASDLHPIKENLTMPSLSGLVSTSKPGTPSFSGNNNAGVKNNILKYQYSFTDSLALVDDLRTNEFKENTKFRRKVHRKAEGASILIMPVDFVHKTKMVFIRLAASTEIHGLLEVKLRSRFVILIVGPLSKKIQLYEIGRAMSASIADDVCRELFYSAEDREEVVDAIVQFNQSTLVIPPSEWNPKIQIEPPETFLSKEERKKLTEMAKYVHDDEIKVDSHENDPTLNPSLRFCYGLSQDIDRKLRFYVSDFTDCLNLQSIAATLYMYLVSLCSLVAFGGLFGQKTDNYMATMECILAGAICGCLFSLFAGQPLNIISATGPVLILEGIIKSLCDKYHIDFMEFRLWIGIWCTVLLVILVVFNLSFLVKYITRFTEDCFATLVAIVFIFDAIKNVYHMRDPHPIQSAAHLDPVVAAAESSLYYTNDSSLAAASTTTPKLLTSTTSTTVEPAIKPSYMTENDVYYLSVLLFLLSFFICTTLKEFRKKPYLPSKIRQIFSDFSVLIAIVATSAIDFYIGEHTKKLIIPSKIHPTRAERPWIIPFFSGKNSWVTVFFAIVPAIIATILIFMDQQITAVIANRKELKLKKSHGYHLDLLIVAICILVSSLFGLPWFVAATVLTLTHINSLKVMSENTAPGEIPTFIGIREQRGTTLIMAILTGLSVFLSSLLSHIPMAALYGVFMFMGVSALHGMQFFERVKILFMPAKYQPNSAIYLRHVKTHRVHLFTIIQLVSTGALYLIKYVDMVAISFPILIVATCGIRKVLDYVFSQRELYWLDDLLPGRKLPVVTTNDILANRRKSEAACKNLRLNLKDENPCIIIDESETVLKSLKDEVSIPFIDTNSPMLKPKRAETNSDELASSPSQNTVHFS